MNEVTRSLVDAVQRLENALLTMPQADIRTEHVFRPGVYERRMIAPPWTVLTGAEHKTDYTVRLEKGTIAVNTEDGMKLFNAPIEFLAKAGIKRAGRVFDAEVVWVDVYDNPDDCTDIPTLEDRLYVVPECGLGENRVAALIERDRQDYQKFLEQLGVDEPTIEAISQIEHDLIPMPMGYAVEVRPSRLHGMGLFACREFDAGEHICPGRLDGNRTPAGRFINHSSEPNAMPTKQGDDIHAVALRLIRQNEEILIDYRASMKVNFDLDVTGDGQCQAG